MCQDDTGYRQYVTKIPKRIHTGGLRKWQKTR